MTAPKNKLMRKLMADKKKFFTFSALLLVGLLMWGRLLLKKIPQTAVADPPAKSAKSAKSSKAGQTDPSAEVIAIPPAPTKVVRVNVPVQLRRDLFQFDAGFYPKIEETTQTDTTEPKVDTQTPDRQQLLEEVGRRFAELNLQTTVNLGGEPRAVINDRILKVGDKIKSFTIKKIGDRTVTVELAGIEKQLSLDTPE